MLATRPLDERLELGYDYLIVAPGGCSPALARVRYGRVTHFSGPMSAPARAYPVHSPVHVIELNCSIYSV